MPLVGKDEIQKDQASADEVGRVAAPVAEIFAVDLSVERFRKQMIHTAHVQVFTPGSVAAAFHLVGKMLRAIAPTRAAKGEELPWLEIPGMGGY
jgi:hypothetical protein